MMMSSRTEIEAQVIDAVQRHLHATDRHLDARTRFVDDLGADSLALAELTLVFEEAFDVDISDEEADKIRTVRDAIAAVEKALRAQRRG
jgi:acyl carrier protein